MNMLDKLIELRDKYQKQDDDYGDLEFENWKNTDETMYYQLGVLANDIVDNLNKLINEERKNNEKADYKTETPKEKKITGNCRQEDDKELF